MNKTMDVPKLKNYSGSDLSTAWKMWARKQLKNIQKHVEAMGCTGFTASIQFYYFSGFFVAPSGQHYYFCTHDSRDYDTKFYYRTCKDYKDYYGGANQFANLNNLYAITLR